MITSIALIAVACAVLLWPAKKPSQMPAILRPPISPATPPRPSITHIDALMALSKVRDRIAMTGGVDEEDEKLLQQVALALLKRSEK